MSYVIRQLHLPGKTARATESTVEALIESLDSIVCGDYLEWSDPNAKFGRGDDRWTRDLAKAKRFPTYDAAFECWRAQSSLVPFRTDGQPNRPMTAYTVTIEEVQ